MNVNLIGMRGVGKSNVARRMSVLTKMSVMSTDTLVTYDTGLTVAQFVAERGWVAFRELELAIVERLAGMSGVIVDCGGGIMVDVDDAGNERYSEPKGAALRRGGPVVWLRGDIPRLAAKTADDPDRPTLHAVRAAEEIMRSREPWYAEASDWSIMVEPGERQQAAEDIVTRLGLWPEPRGTGL